MKGTFFMPQCYITKADGSIEMEMEVDPKNWEALKKTL